MYIVVGMLWGLLFICFIGRIDNFFLQYTKVLNKLGLKYISKQSNGFTERDSVIYSSKLKYEKTEVRETFNEFINSHDLNLNKNEDELFRLFVAGNMDIYAITEEQFWVWVLEKAYLLKLKPSIVPIISILHQLGYKLNGNILLSVIQFYANSSFQNAVEFVFWLISVDAQFSAQHFLPLLREAGNVKNVRKVLSLVDYFGLELNVSLFSAAIKSCEIESNWEGVLEILELMKSLGITPNEITYCLAIAMMSKCYQGEIALSLLQEMTRDGIHPNQLCYGGALTACAKCNMWDKVTELLNDMKLCNIPLQPSILSSVISACRISNSESPMNISSTTNNMNMYSSERILWLIDNYVHMVTDSHHTVVTMAMDVLESYHEYDKIIYLFYRMIEMDIIRSKSSYKYVMRSCVALNDTDCAVQILSDAKSKNMDTSSMYNTTMFISSNSNRPEVALRCLVDMIALSIVHAGNSKVRIPASGKHLTEHENRINTSLSINQELHRPHGEKQTYPTPPINLATKVCLRGLKRVVETPSKYFFLLNGKLEVFSTYEIFIQDIAIALRFIQQHHKVNFPSNMLETTVMIFLYLNDFQSVRAILRSDILIHQHLFGRQNPYAEKFKNIFSYASLFILKNVKPLSTALDTILDIIQDIMKVNSSDVKLMGYDIFIQAAQYVYYSICQTYISEIIRQNGITTDSNELFLKDKNQQTQRFDPTLGFCSEDIMRDSKIMYIYLMKGRLILDQPTLKFRLNEAYKMTANVLLIAKLPDLTFRCYQNALADNAISNLFLQSVLRNLVYSNLHKNALDIVYIHFDQLINLYHYGLIASLKGLNWDRAFELLAFIKDRANSDGLYKKLLPFIISICIQSRRYHEIVPFVPDILNSSIQLPKRVMNIILLECLKGGLDESIDNIVKLTKNRNSPNEKWKRIGQSTSASSIRSNNKNGGLLPLARKIPNIHLNDDRSNHNQLANVDELMNADIIKGEDSIQIAPYRGLLYTKKPEKEFQDLSSESSGGDWLKSIRFPINTGFLSNKSFKTTLNYRQDDDIIKSNALKSLSYLKYARNETRAKYQQIEPELSGVSSLTDMASYFKQYTLDTYQPIERALRCDVQLHKAHKLSNCNFLFDSLGFNVSIPLEMSDAMLNELTLTSISTFVGNDSTDSNSDYLNSNLNSYEIVIQYYYQIQQLSKAYQYYFRTMYDGYLNPFENVDEGTINLLGHNIPSMIEVALDLILQSFRSNPSLPQVTADKDLQYKFNILHQSLFQNDEVQDLKIIFDGKIWNELDLRNIIERKLLTYTTNFKSSSNNCSDSILIKLNINSNADDRMKSISISGKMIENFRNLSIIN